MVDAMLITKISQLGTQVSRRVRQRSGQTLAARQTDLRGSSCSGRRHTALQLVLDRPGTYENLAVSTSASSTMLLIEISPAFMSYRSGLESDTLSLVQVTVIRTRHRLGRISGITVEKVVARLKVIVHVTHDVINLPLPSVIASYHVECKRAWSRVLDVTGLTSTCSVYRRMGVQVRG